MIDWIHEACQDWGDYMRKNLNGWPQKSMAWKLWREQGASGRDKRQTHEPAGALQIFHMENKDISDIHRIWRQMPENLAMGMYACYVKRGGHKAQARWLGVSVTRLYEVRSNVNHYIAGRLYSDSSGQKDSGIITPEKDVELL